MKTTLVCFISNNPDSLELSLAAHSANFTGNTRVMILDTPASHERNAGIAKDYNAIHESETEFRKTVKDEFKPLFGGKYGGNRNICLYHAFKESAHTIFFDDDTTPSENPIAGYEALFSQGKKIVVGKYLRHNTGTPHVIRQVVETLAGYADGDVKAEAAKEKLAAYFAGIPDENPMPQKSVGVVGGNLGVSFDCLSKYCFFPTDYRIEDGTYGMLAKHFTGEEPYNELGNPAVFHNKTPKENALLENLENELKGNTVALCALETLLENELSMETTEDKINRSAELVFKGFNLDYLHYKNHQKGILAKSKELGFQAQVAQLLYYSASLFKPSAAEVEAKTALLEYAEEKWLDALQSGRGIE